MSIHETVRAERVYLSREDGKLTLWDSAGEGRVPAVALTDGEGRVIIDSGADTVAAVASMADNEGE